MTTRAIVAIFFGLAALCAVIWWSAWSARRRLHRLAREQVGLAPRSTPTTRRSNPNQNRIHRRVIETRRQRRRNEALDDQLAPALQLVIGHLRIGRNIVSALAEVAGGAPEPLATILGEVVAESRLGIPLDEVLQTVAAREHNRHLGIVASAIGLHSRHGGSLIEILETVIGTIEEEDRLRRDIRSLTADGRLSARVLMAMPPVMLAFVTATSPGYARPLIDTNIGRFLSISAVVLGTIGWFWLRAIGNPEVEA